MEEATFQQCNNEDDTASHLESQLDFVIDEIMKQITQLRERTH
jgi:hypothetical protein